MIFVTKRMALRADPRESQKLKFSTRYGDNLVSEWQPLHAPKLLYR